MPYPQHSYNSSTLNVVIRTAGDPTALAGTVRRSAAEISPDVPVAFTTMEATVSKRVEDPRFRALLFGRLRRDWPYVWPWRVSTASWRMPSNSDRKRSALRMALGASAGSVLRLILGQGLVLAAAGLALGLAAAVAATRLLETVLFEVRAGRHSRSISESSSCSAS